ncbi:NAD(P)H-dependent oxidoreductase [Mameliella sediminis]|uniref:NAD(P)H-dependent oxidoreductase n=1 Tax=Mameliella sediminis TaxID=2836866 RepID=UPI001C46C715|nr:NAD(P)H-dependent oxidoreductase [Mameliella sediminis]MBY6116019.1 NAD(P)H-dependent oxidoreductase [Antarctobacter heliothermus]MBY6145203.1 NAD(P)H-dependent oxidoreductase [Mameliella alba]MBV7394058.1 NAD(P)H-dependent oxidoreductase [Mameliella sediminis]MBY6162028.1 NAD(P)H-dependent oxidoreductase [Mameliella alba]MBY6170498.1 NAD(P)H-dependent oxidoreductase [Mameliella alba]
MAKVLHIFAHPGRGSSRINMAQWSAAQAVDGITSLDLYAIYPRYDIDIEVEQQRLLDHDLVLLQFPLFWYSAPALVKEWIDLTFEHGFAYGHDGDRLKGKSLMLALSAGGPQDAYNPEGYQHFPLRTFLTPFEQTARLCQMHFLPPYVQYGALRADPAPHAKGFATLLKALRDDRLDLPRAPEVLTHDTLPLIEGDPT